MDTWVKVGVVAAVIQTAIAMLGYFDIASSSLGTPWVWRFLFVSVTLFTWVVLYWIVQRQNKIQQGALARGQGHLIIHSAVYGLGSRRDIDVTGRLRELVENGELHLRVDPEHLGCEDPYPGERKRLRVTCSYGDTKNRTIQRRDYEYLNLPLYVEN